MTPVTEVYDMAMLVIQDYQLDNLAKADYNAFLTYLEGKLMVGIPEIEAHMHDLELVHQEKEQEDGIVQIETYFTRDLSNIEKAIISKASRRLLTALRVLRTLRLLELRDWLMWMVMLLGLLLFRVLSLLHIRIIPLRYKQYVRMPMVM